MHRCVATYVGNKSTLNPFYGDYYSMCLIDLAHQELSHIQQSSTQSLQMQSRFQDKVKMVKVQSYDEEICFLL
jgi:hypothetical protein